jgi:hypothetical protein
VWILVNKVTVTRVAKLKLKRLFFIRKIVSNAPKIKKGKTGNIRLVCKTDCRKPRRVGSRVG